MPKANIIQHHYCTTPPLLHTHLNYRLFQVLLDLDHLDNLNHISRLWSLEKFNLVAFHRNNYLPGKSDLKQTVIDKIHAETGKHFNGRVQLLTNLSYYGHCFNPVSFYFCYEKSDVLSYILADINNTPWDERHCYVHDCSDSQQFSNSNKNSHAKDKTDSNIDSRQKYSFHFDKQFHISPMEELRL